MKRNLFSSETIVTPTLLYFPLGTVCLRGPGPGLLFQATMLRVVAFPYMLLSIMTWFSCKRLAARPGLIRQEAVADGVT